MNSVNIGIIGAGRQGTNYIRMFMSNQIQEAHLIAVCDINSNRIDAIKTEYPQLNFYKDFKDMLSKEPLNGVIIVTPHITHPDIAAYALNEGLYVLSDKPMGVSIKKAIKAFENTDTTKFQMMFNQRTIPEYKFLYEIAHNDYLGKIKAYTWEITDWYRPQAYYDLPDWHSTWYGEGGGLIINQCVHNLDLLCWLFGTPEKVRAELFYGRYHQTLVDDAAIVTFSHENNVIGLLSASTGELPGTNRLEISFDKGKVIREKNGTIEIYENEICETVHSKTCKMNQQNGKFARPKVIKKTRSFDIIGHGHVQMIQNFICNIKGTQRPLTSFIDGKDCLQTINSIYLSSWMNKEVNLKESLDEYDKLLKIKIKEENKK